MSSSTAVPPRSSALASPLSFVSLSSHLWWADAPQLGAQKLIFMYEGDEVFNLEHVCSGGADGQVVQSMDPDLAGRCIAAIEEQRAPLPCPRRQLFYLFRLLFLADLSLMTLPAISHHMHAMRRSNSERIDCAQVLRGQSRRRAPCGRSAFPGPSRSTCGWRWRQYGKACSGCIW